MSNYKPYPAYRDSGVEWIGEVPDHWDIKRLRQVSTFTNSGIDKKSYEGQELVSLCNYTDVYYNEFITANMPFMRATASKVEIAQFTLKKGDLIITKDSEDPSDIGIPALVIEDVPGVVCGYHLTLIRIAELATARFLHRVLQSTPTHAYFFIESPGITRYGLGQDVIGDLRICMPPINEISKIADSIDREVTRIDSLIAKKTRFIEILTEKILTLAANALNTPEDAWVRLEHLTNVVRRPVVQTDGCSYTKLGLLNRGRGIFKKEESDTEDMGDSDFFWIKKGDLIISGQFSWEGAVALATNEHTDCVVSHRFPVLEGKPGVTLTEYLFAFFMTPHGDFILNECSRGSAGRNKPLNMNTLLKWKIPVPSLEDQINIARLIWLREGLRKKTHHSIALLKERRSAFITANVTGQIDLREPA